MSLFKIVIYNRNYSSWLIEPFFNKEINPLTEKFFSKDTFTFDKKLIHSQIRSGISIPAVLVLLGNKTFGRYNNKKLFYKCIPDDAALPIFLVPYEMKNVGFSKVFKNMYVTISFHEWIDKHPTATLQHVIGPVDDLTSFYEYQLYCKELNHSINKFQKDVSKALKISPHDAFIENIKTRYPSIKDRTQDPWYIFSIDPSGSLDFDDAFSIQDTKYNNIPVKKISIYISNVSIWIDILNLWDSFTRRISTIYLPDKKRPMMPAALGDGICSLQQNVTRIALTLDIYLSDDVIVKTEYCNAFINVRKNYCYEEPNLLNDSQYCNLLHTVNSFSQKTSKTSSNINDSHELVSFLMILMNHHCARELAKYRSKGIFRKTIPSTRILESAVPDLKSFAGNYVEFSDSLHHETLGLDTYIHITSPIRRIVDLLNIIVFQNIVMNFHELSSNSITF
jgi:exoribonuclease R